MPIDLNAHLRAKVIPRYTEATLPEPADRKHVLVVVTDANGGNGEYRFSTGSAWLTILTNDPATGIMTFYKKITGTALTNAFDTKPIIIAGGPSWSGKLLDIISANMFIVSQGAATITNATGNDFELGDSSGNPFYKFDATAGINIAGTKKVTDAPRNYTGSYASNFTGMKLFLPVAAATMGFVSSDEIHIHGTYRLIERSI